MNLNQWVLVNKTKGTTVNGKPLTNSDLEFIAQAIEIQMNRDYATEVGYLSTSVRVAQNENDIQVGEKPYVFVDNFNDIPGAEDASAYHDVEGNGVEAGHCAISTCQDAFGPDGCGKDGSHEVLEDAGNPGCNRAVDDGNGTMHEDERCDAIETQVYAIPVTIGGVTNQVYVANFLLDTWKIPNAPPPYTFMTKAQIPGGEDPSGPFQTVITPSGQGNYQIEFPSSSGQANDVFANKHLGNRHAVLNGVPKKLSKAMHPRSRAQRIIQNHNRTPRTPL